MEPTESNEDAQRVEEEYLLRRSLSIRLKMASQLELSLIIAATYLVVIAKWFDSSRNDILARLTDLIYEPQFLISLGMVFAEAFAFILTGRTILVGIIAPRISSIGDLLNRTPAQPRAVDPIQQQFRDYISRSREALRTAERRPNALLAVGSTVAMFGLLFFILTLPNSNLLTTASIAVSMEQTALADRWIELFPRLLMLIFIQVLAGFFLRQYRASMEELRYFEALLRTRESQFLCFQILSTTKDAQVAQFAQSLVSDNGRDMLRLQQGETTVILEAQRGDMNEFKGLYESLFEVLKKPFERGTKAAE